MSSKTFNQIKSESQSPNKKKRKFSFKSITLTSSSKTIQSSSSRTCLPISSRTILPVLNTCVKEFHSKSSPYIGHIQTPKKQFHFSYKGVKEYTGQSCTSNSPMKGLKKSGIQSKPLKPLKEQVVLKNLDSKTLPTLSSPQQKPLSLDITQTDDEKSEVSVVWDNKDLDERRLRQQIDGLPPTELFVFLYKYRSEQHPNIQAYLPTERLRKQVNKFGNQGKQLRSNLLKGDFANSDLINNDYSSPKKIQRISRLAFEEIIQPNQINQ